MIVVEFALESMKHGVALGKAGCFKRVTGVERAIAAPADNDHGSVNAGRLFDMSDEMRIDVPVGAVIPCHMDGPDGMANEQVFHFTATINEYRIRSLLEEFVGLFGFQVFHGGTPSHIGSSIIGGSRPSRKSMIKFALSMHLLCLSGAISQP